MFLRRGTKGIKRRKNVLKNMWPRKVVSSSGDRIMCVRRLMLGSYCYRWDITTIYLDSTTDGVILFFPLWDMGALVRLITEQIVRRKSMKNFIEITKKLKFEKKEIILRNSSPLPNINSSLSENCPSAPLNIFILTSHRRQPHLSICSTTTGKLISNICPGK